ncbi:hypothetical protein STRTUCAR8_08634 [Streptomyces turgidiscabies Car8]|uniref:Phage protein n=1 Tax=Streptomyces turgidiscabies (strain Car8) TaxID=698760 RepID=L7FG54_STRT8|nr:hypothetical protein [Streptomyces turgidiscabies]ELP70041.1 hypothetical protein STRTUCAR8_08634 [Streptomyces turgidiscabies Car8]
MTTTFVAMNHRGPIATALTVEAAQREAVRTARQGFGASEYDYFWVDSKPFVTRPGECVLMRKPKGKRVLPAEGTSYKVVATAYVADEKTFADSPFPVGIRATPGGAELDVSAFLVKAVFAELISKADDDPKALVVELAGMADLLRSAVGQGRDSHARHAFDEKMQGFVKEFADDGVIPVYGDAVRRMAERLSQIAAPRPVPGQREAGAA